MVAGVYRLGAHFDLETSVWSIAVWSERASSVTLVIAHRDHPFRSHLERQLTAGPDGVWSVEVSAAAIGDADLYGFRVDGPWAPLRGDRFDPAKVLLDPYALRVWSPPALDRDAARVRGTDTIGRAPWGVLVVERPRPQRPPRPLVDAPLVAEVHVGAFTGSPTSGLEPHLRGTFLGMIERLDHLSSLGVTAVELLPVHATDPAEGSAWGYMPLAFLAIDDRYAVHDPAAEFAQLADACHERGMELWVDVVYNHTTEEDHLGPTYSWRGFGNREYYVITDVGEYVDDAGCGNILAASHRVVGDMVIASLERLVDLGVDGFRFDLASVLGRDDPGLIERISAWAADHGVRLVAEPWDVARYQVGPAFPGTTWMQWNDRFRDVVRSFVKGVPGYVSAMEEVVSGSPHLFPDTPRRSVNFVTAHDGFTLRDLVSYQSKRNAPNGHGNTDGTDDNRSWNCGWEGDDDVPADVASLRARQVRNFFTVLMCSAGTPMLLAGDEMGRTQCGNNNAYRADDESVWFDWSLADASGDLVRFVTELAAFRRSHPSLSPARHWGDDVTFLHAGTGHDLAWWVRGEATGTADVVVAVNAHWSPCRMPLPEGRWARIVDTSQPPPSDIVVDQHTNQLVEQLVISDGHIDMAPRSVLVLEAC